MGELVYKSDVACDCGEFDIIVTTGFVGYMGSKPCYESYGKCPKCKKEFNNNEIDNRFVER